jgi:hypothetical protein
MPEVGGAGSRRDGEVGASAGDTVGWSDGNSAAPAVAINAAKPVAVEKTKNWDTRNLGWRIGADAVSAASAGVLVAPIITVIDR